MPGDERVTATEALMRRADELRRLTPDQVREFMSKARGALIKSLSADFPDIREYAHDYILDDLVDEDRDTLTRGMFERDYSNWGLNRTSTQELTWDITFKRVDEEHVVVKAGCEVIVVHTKRELRAAVQTLLIKHVLQELW